MMIVFLLAVCVIFFIIIIGRNGFRVSHLPPLHQAARDGNTAEVARLLDDGADINAKSKDGVTPLHDAVINGQTLTAYFLITLGADVNAKCKGDLTPLHFAAGYGHTKIALFLIREKANVNAQDENGCNTCSYSGRGRKN